MFCPEDCFLVIVQELMIEKFYSHARTTDPRFAESITRGNQSGSGKVLPF